jgi:hypothetical protein
VWEVVAWGAGALRGGDTGVPGARGHAQGPPDALRARTRSVTAYHHLSPRFCGWVRRPVVGLSAVANTENLGCHPPRTGPHVAVRHNRGSDAIHSNRSVCSRERFLFIGTQFSNLYTAVNKFHPDPLGNWVESGSLTNIYVCMRVCVCVCVCVCERERERERESVCVSMCIYRATIRSASPCSARAQFSRVCTHAPIHSPTHTHITTQSFNPTLSRVLSVSPSRHFPSHAFWAYRKCIYVCMDVCLCSCEGFRVQGLRYNLCWIIARWIASFKALSEASSPETTPPGDPSPVGDGSRRAPTRARSSVVCG